MALNFLNEQPKYVGSCKQKHFKECTTSLKQPEAPEGEEWDEDRTNQEMKDLLARDPYAPLLSSIADDKKISVSKTLQ